MQCSHTPPKLTGLEQALIDKVEAVNDLTLKQLCDWLQNEHGMRVGVSTLWKTLARLGVSLKKVTPCMRANAPGRSAGPTGMAGTTI